MTIGEAASLLGVSVRTVRQMCKAYEDDREKNVPEGEAGGLPFAWTSPNSKRRDINGHALRGHRRPFADAVRAMARETGRLGGTWGTQNLPVEHS